MKTSELMRSATATFYKVAFKIRKKSPEILIGVGIISAVAGAVVACKATTKAEKVIEKANESLDVIHEADQKGITQSGESYSKDDYKKDLTITYIQTGKELVKLYAPAFVLGAVSISSILASHNVMKKRNVAWTTAYAAMDESFKKYRNRVRERFGEQVEKELRYNIKAQEIEETVTNEKGKERKEKKTVDVAKAGWDPSQYSPYARFFDETHPEWLKDPEMNMFHLKARQSQANDMLKSRGHLLLNEVYDLLGFPRTKAGAVVGWIYDTKNPIGDNFVDFGIFDIHKEAARDFVNGYEAAILLDFNVAGDITDEIEEHQYF